MDRTATTPAVRDYRRQSAPASVLDWHIDFSDDVRAASHFLISTHPQDCTALLGAHLAAPA